MSIKPIDLQTNIGHLHDVAKNEQARTENALAKQHFLDNEADEKSKLQKSRLNESKKAEKGSIELNEKKGQGQRRRNNQNPGQKEQRKTKTEIVENGNLGRIIDIKK